MTRPPNVPPLNLNGISNASNSPDRDQAYAARPNFPGAAAGSSQLTQNEEEDQKLFQTALSATVTMMGACALSTSVLSTIRHRECRPLVCIAGIGLLGTGYALVKRDTAEAVAAVVGLGLGIALSI